MKTSWVKLPLVDVHDFGVAIDLSCARVTPHLRVVDAARGELRVSLEIEREYVQTKLPDVAVTLAEVSQDDAHNIRRGAVVWLKMLAVARELKKRVRRTSPDGSMQLDGDWYTPLLALLKLVDLVDAHSNLETPWRIVERIRPASLNPPQRGDAFAPIGMERAWGVSPLAQARDAHLANERAGLLVDAGPRTKTTGPDQAHMGDFQLNEFAVCGTCGMVHLAKLACAVCGGRKK